MGDLHFPSSRVTLTFLHSCQSWWFPGSISVPEEGFAGAAVAKLAKVEAKDKAVMAWWRKCIVN